MNETQLTETLDERGMHDDARGPGCYALRVWTPGDAESVARKWLEHNDEPLPEPWPANPARDRVGYVGASVDVYGRLCDHVAGDVRKAAFLEAFPPVGVIGVWPAAEPFDDERNRALSLARDGWTVMCDGEVLRR